MRNRKKPEEPPYPNGEPPEGDPEAEGDIVTMHQEYVERRLQGGAPATPQAYARAMAQWQKLPGAIASLADTDLTQAQEAPPPEVDTPTPAQDREDEEQQS